MNNIQTVITNLFESQMVNGTIRTERLILKIPQRFIIESGMNGWKDFCNWLHSEIERYGLLWVSTDDIDGTKVIELHKATSFTKKCTSIIRGQNA